MSFFVMTKIVLKSLFRKPATLLYPFKKRIYPKHSRGSIVINIANCIFCGICARKCPTAALEVFREAKAWEIDRLRCIACGYCVSACPKKCLSMESAYAPASKDQQKERFSNA